MHIGQHNILTRMNFTINTRDGRKTFYKHFGNLIEMQYLHITNLKRKTFDSYHEK